MEPGSVNQLGNASVSLVGRFNHRDNNSSNTNNNGKPRYRSRHHLPRIVRRKSAAMHQVNLKSKAPLTGARATYLHVLSPALHAPLVAAHRGEAEGVRVQLAPTHRARRLRGQGRCWEGGALVGATRRVERAGSGKIQTQKNTVHHLNNNFVSMPDSVPALVRRVVRSGLHC